MSLFGKKEKARIIELEEELERLKGIIPPEGADLFNLQERLKKARSEDEIIRTAIREHEGRLKELEEQLIETDENLLLQSFGFYTPHYTYATSDEYKEKLKKIRDVQKEMIKKGTAVTGNSNWQVNGSAAKGKKMVQDMQKLLLRAYNSECDDAVEHVKFSNILASEKKIQASADAISKLGTMMGISIAFTYVELKLHELRLMHEYQVKKQEEKEAAKEARQRQKEEAKAQKELEESKRKLEKEQSHYENALSKLNQQIETASEEDKGALIEKQQQLQEKLGETEPLPAQAGRFNLLLKQPKESTVPHFVLSAVFCFVHFHFFHDYHFSGVGLT